MNASHTTVLATSRFATFADALCAAAPDRLLRCALLTSFFPNGETRLEIESIDQITDTELLLIGGTEKEDLFDLLLVGNEAARRCRRLNILIPFFRYATQEDKDPGKPGHIVLARGMAEILSGLPRARAGNRVFLVDPHTEELASYFDASRVLVETISCSRLLAEIIDREIPGSRAEKVICSVDDGQTEAVQTVSAVLGIPSAFVAKERVSGTVTRIIGDVSGDVGGKIAVLVDDMGRTLGSAAGAAQAYLQAGAREVWVVVTHADYAPQALEKLRAKHVVKAVITTDTYHMANVADGVFGRVVSAAPFLADELGRHFAR